MLIIETDQDKTSSILGKDSNAMVWPHGPFDDDDEDGIAAYKNQRIRRLGACASVSTVFILGLMLGARR